MGLSEMISGRRNGFVHIHPAWGAIPLGFALLLLLCSLSGLPPQGWAAAATPAEPTEQEKALRQRVEDFYSAMQLGRWEQAENFLMEESRETFRHLEKSTFMGFQVEAIKIDPDAQNATVGVNLQVILPIHPAPVSMPRISHWRLVKNVWYVVLPKEDSSMPLFAKGTPKPNPPEQLKFKGHRYHLGTVFQGQVKVARFPFTNVTDHVVTIKDVDTGGGEWLRVKLDKREYKPGESGEVVVEFDAKKFMYFFAQSIMVKTDPDDVTTYLTVTANVSPPVPVSPASEDKKAKTDPKS